jgi:alpha-beta hydrolase superfamily lysophospholipase
MDEAVLDMVRGSPRLTGFAGGPAQVDAMLRGIEDVWLEPGGARLHLDLHASERPRASIVFQPGSGAHARVYFLLGGLLARRGYHFLAIDRPGHGLSEGERGDCTVEEALAATAACLDYARRRFGLPVVLMGSSMGGLLTVFALLSGLRPDLAVAHNFVYPGRLFSLRMRARWIARHRQRPYPLSEFVHGFERLSADPSVAVYMKAQADPGFAWQLTPRSIASLFAFRAAVPRGAPPALFLTGSRDAAIPAWATRFFAWLSGLPDRELRVLPGAGHLLFHDHLDETVPLVAGWLDAKLAVVAKQEASAEGARSEPRGE